MKSITPTDWNNQIKCSGDEISKWLANTTDQQWHSPVSENWTIKDLVGHLSAWSNFLSDQIELLAKGEHQKIKQVNIDIWNDKQIKFRTDWSIKDIQMEWESALVRILYIIKHLPNDFFTHKWDIAWSPDPVGVADLLDLWLVHIAEHQEIWRSINKKGAA